MRSQEEILALHLNNTTTKQPREVIMILVQAFHEKREPTHMGKWDEAYKIFMTKQHAIEHSAFLGGMRIKEIVSVQVTHLRNIKSRKSGKKLTAETIIKVQEIFMEIWYAKNDELLISLF